jgi:hypothetical protein
MAASSLRAGGLPSNGDEVDDPDAGRQFDEPLLEAEQQVLDLGGLGLGLAPGDLADGDEVLPAVMAEDEPVDAVPFLEAGHGCPQCHRDRVARLLPTASRAHEKRVTPLDVTPDAA